MSDEPEPAPTDAVATDEPADSTETRTVRYGIYSEAACLPHENPRELRELRRQIRNCVKPVGAVEQTVADQVVMLTWRLRRNLETEAAVVASRVEDAETHYGKWEAAQRNRESLVRPAPTWFYAQAVRVDAQQGALLHRLSLQESRLQRQLERALRELWRLQQARGKLGLPDHLEAAILGAITRGGGLPMREAYLETRRAQGWQRGDEAEL